MTRPVAVVISLLLTALIVAGCGGPKRPDLEPPDVTIVELTLDGETAELQVRVDNTVAAPMEVDRLVLDVEIRGQAETRLDIPFGLTIPPLGSEVVNRSIPFTNDGRGQMDYSVSGQAILAGGRTLRFEREGRLYPTPGKPGSFR